MQGDTGYPSNRSGHPTLSSQSLRFVCLFGENDVPKSRPDIGPISARSRPERVASDSQSHQFVCLCLFVCLWKPLTPISARSRPDRVTSDSQSHQFVCCLLNIFNTDLDPISARSCSIRLPESSICLFISGKIDRIEIRSRSGTSSRRFQIGIKILPEGDESSIRECS